MFAKLTAAALLGVDAYAVEIEVDVAGGLPGMMIVGLPDAAVQESRERVRSAVRNAGLPFPATRIVVNLAPADVRKEGPAFDLPIALAILLAQGVVQAKALEHTLIVGELALDGALRPVRGVINVALFAVETGITRLIVAPDNAQEAAAIGGLEVYAPTTLAQTVAFLQGGEVLEAYPSRTRPGAGHASRSARHQGSERRQTRPRDRGGGRAQPADDRPARFGQNDAGAAVTEHHAASDPR